MINPAPSSTPVNTGPGFETRFQRLGIRLVEGEEGANPAPAANPAAPAGAPEAPKPAFTPEQQAFINDLVQTRVKSAQESATDKARKEAEDKTAKTVEEQVAAIREQLETQAKTAEATAVRSIVARATAGTHNPGVATQLVLSQLGELTSADEDAILAKAAEFLTANPYLVKTDAAAPGGAPAAPAAAPGVAAAPVEAAFFTREQMDALTVEQLSGDEELYKKYLRSADHLATQGK